MSKKVLGLDLGVNSVGFALVKADDNPEKSEIIKMGVRIVSEDPDFHGNFYSGNSASKNEPRRIKRMIRRLNHRYKMRRDQLVDVLQKYNMMPDDELLHGLSALELYDLRSKALREKVSLEELGRIFYHLNQRRGFLSNRKSESTDEESGSEYLQKVKALEQQVKNKTIGEYFYSILQKDPKARIRENVFPRKDYIREFDEIWKTQKAYYPEILSGSPSEQSKKSLYHLIRNEIIYYQRDFKSQKHLISKCSFEPRRRVAPKSSPWFQLYRIWQQINNIEFKTPENEPIEPGDEDKINLFKALHDPKSLTQRGTFSFSKILKVCNLPKDCYSNYKMLEGNKTYILLYSALEKAGINDPKKYLDFAPDFDQEEPEVFEQQPFYKLWHITYSLPTEKEVIDALKKHFGFTEEQAVTIAKYTGYNSEYGNVSVKAIKKLLPHIKNGKKYHEACELVGYKHYDPKNIHFSEEDLIDRLPLLPQNSLKNPVVEQILNQVVNIVNEVAKNYGKPDEIRIEMARELKSNYDQRKRMTKRISELRKQNEEIAQRLKNEFQFKRINARDILRWRLWEETNKKCIFSGRQINFHDVYNGVTEIEHVLPKSRSFNNSMNNYILAYREENKKKGQMTAYDYMASKSEDKMKEFVNEINKLFDEGKISKAKRDNLLCTGADIPDNFIERQKKDSQYIAKEAVTMLKKFCGKVTTTTGSVTDFLRDRWHLKHLMQELNLPNYKSAGKTEIIEVKDGEGNPKKVEKPIEWSKRDDHRHHAVDALIVAFTNQSIIQTLNNLNKQYEKYSELKTSQLDFVLPMPNLRNEAKKHLEEILVSFKKPNSKVLTKKVNRIKTKKGDKVQETWVPRGSLHEDTIFGQIKWYEKVPLNKKFDKVDRVVNKTLKGILKSRLEQNENIPAKAFNNLKKNPILYKDVPVEEVVIWNPHYTKRVKLSDNITQAQVNKIVDKKVKQRVQSRIDEAGSIKKAFKNYEENLLYLDKGKNIPIKSITVFDQGTLKKVRDGYAYTKGNHHALIFTDNNGGWMDKVVTFWEAVEHCQKNIEKTGKIYPIIDKTPPEGWSFYTTLQINDLFVIGLDPSKVDFMDPENKKLISHHLYRLQKLSKKYYVFRHHLETTIDREEDFAFKRLQSLKWFQNIVKVRINKLGDIIHIGE